MSFAWLMAVAVVTQYEPSVLERPEVRAFIGPPTPQVELYARLAGGWVAGVVQRSGVAPTYFVLDEQGRIEPKATGALGECVGPSRNNPSVELNSLAGERGVVVAHTCLVDRGEVLPVHEVLGGAWNELGTGPSGITDEAAARFRASAEYLALADAEPPPVSDAVKVPNSGLDLVQVWSRHANAFTGQRDSRVFVVERRSKRIDAERTEALAHELRRELVGVCGTSVFTLAPHEAGAVLSGETNSRWEGDGCSGLVTFEAATGELHVNARDFEQLMSERQQRDAVAKHHEAEALLARGDAPGALSTWTPIFHVLQHGPEREAMCRGILRAHLRLNDERDGRVLYEQCTAGSPLHADALLELASFHVRHHEPADALTRYEQALRNPLSDAEQLAVRRTVARIELDLADAAAQAGHAALARLHYRRALDGPLSRAFAARARKQLRSLE